MYDMEQYFNNEYKDDDVISVHARIDDPFIIDFENEERLEIDFSDFSSLKIGMNSLPKKIAWSCNENNIDMNVMFKECLNKKIVDFKINTTENLGFFTGSYGMTDPDGDIYIDSIELLLENDYKIVFESFFDYGEVYIYCNEEICKISYLDLKNAFIERKYN